ncbi:MAG: hypothetical protein IJH04_06070 [Eggerthellaceae bacterium]|nr:hypothetical protein [Eggerthellaceae bacterium]
MRKNNWIVYVIVLLVSAFLLWLWYWLGFDHVDAPLDLVLSVIWWIGVALACFGIHRVEEKRRMRIRTCYVAPNLLYNSEAGTQALRESDAETVVLAVQSVLEGLEYGFDIKERPEDAQGNKIPFEYVISSEVFEVKREDEEGSDARNEVTWKGEVAIVSRPDDEPLVFGNVDELCGLVRKLAPVAPVS